MGVSKIRISWQKKYLRRLDIRAGISRASKFVG